jgi:hypothetical protein
MSMVRRQLLVHPKADAELKALSEETGLSVSDLIRRAVDQYLLDLGRARNGKLPSSDRESP